MRNIYIIYPMQYNEVDQIIRIAVCRYKELSIRNYYYFHGPSEAI